MSYDTDAWERQKEAIRTGYVNGVGEYIDILTAAERRFLDSPSARDARVNIEKLRGKGYTTKDALALIITETTKDALALIITEIATSDDPRKTGSDWMVKVTEAISQAIHEIEGE